MQIKSGRMRINALLLLLVLVGGLWYSPATGSAAFIQNESQLSPEIIISSVNNEKFLPAVAYNSKHDEYLVVWHNKWPSRDIYAQRISSSGQLLSWFAVAPGPGTNTYDRSQPSVAYDPLNDRYLVVFIHDVFGDGSDYDIHGRFIPWNGPDPTLLELTICGWNSDQWNPQVVFGRAQEEFMVVWANTPTGQPAYISAARINHDTGAVIDDLTVSSGTENRINPDIAYNLARNEYLVVWDRVGTSHDIYAARLNGVGAVLGTGEIAVAGWPDDEEVPTVAACRLTDQYLVGWQSLVGPPTNYDVYARYVSGEGLLGWVFLVDGTTSPEIEIDASCFLDGPDYLVAWQTRYTNLYYGIWARLVHPNSLLEDSFLVVQPGATADRLTPAIGGGKVSFLVTWVHDRDGTAYQDIRGRLFWPYRTYMPMISR